MQDDAGKDEVGKCSLGTDAELALVSGVALDTQTNCVEGRNEIHCKTMLTVLYINIYTVM